MKKLNPSNNKHEDVLLEFENAPEKIKNYEFAITKLSEIILNMSGEIIEHQKRLEQLRTEKHNYLKRFKEHYEKYTK